MPESERRRQEFRAAPGRAARRSPRPGLFRAVEGGLGVCGPPGQGLCGLLAGQGRACCLGCPKGVIGLLAGQGRARDLGVSLPWSGRGFLARLCFSLESLLLSQEFAPLLRVCFSLESLLSRKSLLSSYEFAFLSRVCFPLKSLLPSDEFASLSRVCFSLKSLLPSQEFASLFHCPLPWPWRGFLAGPGCQWPRPGRAGTPDGRQRRRAEPRGSCRAQSAQ